MKNYNLSDLKELQIVLISQLHALAEQQSLVRLRLDEIAKEIKRKESE